VPIADTYAYCLLPNHFHFLARIKLEEEIIPDLTGLGKPVRSEPSQYFSNLFNAYTKAFNLRYGRTGTLFHRPFGRIPVTSERYFYQLIIYIHRNPQKHGFVADFRDWPYTSYNALLSEQPTRVARDRVLDWFGGRDSFRLAHGQDVDATSVAAFLGDQT
jgi:hypothetical protein